jgi:tetratricopeptide (TPR) repeat protein
MFKKSMSLVSMIAITSGLLIFWTYTQSDSQGLAEDEAYYTQEGLSYFKEGFCKLTPKGKKQEAAQKYEQAIAAFEKAIAINGSYVEAHRHLARVYYVQRRFSEAAESYKKVTELSPGDIDVYVKLASAYARMNKYSEAVQQLEKAKAFTNDKVVVSQLDEFIQRLREGQ